MFGFADLLLNTSRYLDIDNAPVLRELGESQECYVVIRHDVWLCFVNVTTPEIKLSQEAGNLQKFDPTPHYNIHAFLCHHYRVIFLRENC